MAVNLLESYKNRLAVSEATYARANGGASLSNNKKMVIAKLLENTNKVMNEAFENSTGTQRSDMGAFRKFALNLTTVAVPNLIAFDLVIVQPMSSMAGYVNYIEYVAGSNKGATAQGDVFNSPFGLGKVDTNYTADRVVETVSAANAGTFAAAWTPVVEKAFYVKDGKEVKFGTEGATWAAYKTVKADGTVEYSATAPTVAEGDKVAYVYDNVVIPQNDLPIMSAQMKTIPLVAKARRIAIYYSQMAAFQAKQDYGFDLGDQLAEKAVGQLAYEIDTEVCQLLIDNAPADGDLVWSKTLPVGVSKQEHYAGFVEILEMASQKIYDRTKRFSANYMLIASNIMPILAFVPGFQAAPAGKRNGPYFAGTLNGVKVYVTPNIAEGKFVVGVNGDDMMSSAAVYAPYMAVTPTQLLGYADGAMSQGWSTMYDLKLLNDKLLVAGRVTA